MAATAPFNGITKSRSRMVLITGVSKGLGRALALKMGNRGHTVIGCSRTQEKLNSFHSEFPNSNSHLFLDVDEVAPYCASKWAVGGLSRSVAKELPDGITIVALNPGFINSDMLASSLATSAALYQAPDACFEGSYYDTQSYWGGQWCISNCMIKAPI